MTKLKGLHLDASADGRRGIFTSMKLLTWQRTDGAININTTKGP